MICGHFIPLFPFAPVPSLDDWGHGNQSSHGLYGASVATLNFLRYHMRYGHFDQYHLLVPGAILRADLDLREKLLGKLASDRRIGLRVLEEFSSASRADYHAIHHPEGPKCLKVLSLRNQQRACKVPITAVTHTISYQEILGDFALLLLAGMRPWDSIVCTSKSGRDAFRNLLVHVSENISREMRATVRYDGRLDTIPLGVDTKIYQPREKFRLRQMLELPTGKVILLWFGRFSVYDKADLRPLLIAFQKACNDFDGDKLILLLAGEDKRGGYADTVANFAADLGLADRLLIRKNPALATGPLYYAASDVFVCPSDNIQETFGQTVIEAMSSGLPVICSDWNGFRDTVVHGHVGFRIPTYWAQCDSRLCDNAPVSPRSLDHLYLSQSVCVDVDQMANSITILARDEQLRRRMGDQARKHAVTNFDWQVVIGEYERLWDMLNSIAASSRPVPGRRAGWSKPAYVSHFKGYATKILDQAMIVRTSKDLTKLPEIRQSIYSNMGLDSQFRYEIADLILRHANKGISFVDLQNRVAKLGMSRENTTWYIMRLLKYGYLCLPNARALGGYFPGSNPAHPSAVSRNTARDVSPLRNRLARRSADHN